VNPRFATRLARFNLRFTNHLTGPFAARLPGLGVIVHTGRRSGRRYRTPVTVFAAPGGYVVALIYGVDSQWVRNVVAAGGCELDTRGRREQLTGPVVFHDETRSRVAPAVRPILRMLGVADFMQLSKEGS
jgi:deazaflavin-dependent oxidoreductase (nitroreductase family)